MAGALQDNGFVRAGAELGAFTDRLAADGLAFTFHNHDWELQRFADGRLALDILLEAARGSVLHFQPDLAWIAGGGQGGGLPRQGSGGSGRKAAEEG
jgi:hypothetical protein